ncbi:ATPase subunit of ABC transporter with duplicated ATPase domains [Kitasatospora sp. MAP12-15]|uniref:ABC-F family ATP-binding cassette domain-containing protein n=1 Tax=unclassified Kitasatospora TaxID=2633591 RepID=UPI002474AEC3|nr:ABC-F family ATP-binding cassette domain-containing protein [Kitasatospora sp. MAP12-44]MDH6109803.1 ATPase subunit of ABC transporter with duplicated ATPase domains [Kitasatospora sp. MAP12-44]
MTSPTTSILCTDLSFEWPDGKSVLERFHLAVGPGRTGLIGLNGAGKSTLLRLLAGELTPGSGSVRVAGEIGYLPQGLTLDTELRVDEALGIRARRQALHAIESGDVAEAHFTALGDDWDVEERARATLDRLGLGALDLDRTTGELSGGEAVLLRLAALLLERPDVLLLDEPTNNLDRWARARLYEAVQSWTGVLVVVSHDRELLAHVDQIADLRDGGVRWYGGNYAAYERTLAAEQETAERAVRSARADVDRQKRDLIDARHKLERSAVYGRKRSEQRNDPKIISGALQRKAEVTAGRVRGLHSDRLEDARERLNTAEEAVRDDAEIRIDLPRTEVPAGRTVLMLDNVRPVYGASVKLELRGPERIALIGRNGSGKSTLLRAIAGELPPLAGEISTPVALRHLPQRLDLLDDTLSVVQNVKQFAPAQGDNLVRARLARFLFRGGRADQLAGTLSGGERFRATLAALLLADPPPQLLLLDEPTNNLDLASTRQLTQALASYRGALVVASHDLPFLRGIGVTRWLQLDERGLRPVDPS